MANQARASDVAGGLGSIVRVLRMMLQSAVLGVGAYLVINQEASAGIIIASSILAGRALAPVDLAIANWKGFVAARQSWARLGKLLGAIKDPPEALKLPAPRSQLSVEAASVAPPGAQKLVVVDSNFSIKSGTGLGIIGPSASGKSSLARMLVGVWQPARGAIRLDGAELGQWNAAERGRYIGYLPQDVELIAGSVAENIARFDPQTSDEAVIAAAKAAGVHELIVGLPQGYETQVGDNGSLLSAGQQQRVALARALYGDPFLVVLDEPNSNLDAEGEEALTKAILGVRSRGGIAVVIAHRPSALAGVDMVLVLARGRQQAFGPKEEVLAKVLRREPTPLKLATDSERGSR
jgi:ATP-binding cassette subfamily C protein